MKINSNGSASPSTTEIIIKTYNELTDNGKLKIRFSNKKIHNILFDKYGLFINIRAVYVALYRYRHNLYKSRPFGGSC
jgi:hypothetical protein